MIRAKDQLPDEPTYPHLAKLLRSGGTLEVGEDFSIGAFARVRKGNRVVVVDTAYRDFAAILKEMDSLARNHFEQES
jgi:hypothetical protein